MFAGQLVAIYIGPQRGGAMQPVSSAEASPGQGLSGDRYSAPVRGKQPSPTRRSRRFVNE